MTPFSQLQKFCDRAEELAASIEKKDVLLKEIPKHEHLGNRILIAGAARKIETDFIAASRTLLPQAVAVIRLLSKTIEELREHIERPIQYQERDQALYEADAALAQAAELVKEK
jgi:hypothetical protein